MKNYRHATVLLAALSFCLVIFLSRVQEIYCLQE